MLISQPAHTVLGLITIVYIVKPRGTSSHIVCAFILSFAQKNSSNAHFYWILKIRKGLKVISWIEIKVNLHW